ncbi:hypothetical protein FHW88_000457 [Mucilaginibacter sp. SG538B]|uniref:hypothetical protein n=1 Tax=Mucilaginibacter sp. SG538B TaxID=2587021 RepID=UPI00159D36F4|nr:hypothetical protein [Mucilaginibacter sp. SG538B]NVM62181.1 hypothetical protein [Mucilaginibacter sp. SG538B]
MKKAILLLSFLFATSIVAQAQWTTSGTVTSTSNSVGIGVANTTAQLSLGPSAINKKLFIYDTGTEASGLGQGNSEFRIFGVSSGINHISFGKYLLTADSFTEQMRIDNVGNVGIGTTAPQTKLDVAGGITASSESHYYLGSYVDPVVGIGFAVKIGANGIAVNGNSVFNDGLSIGTQIMPSGYKLAVNGSAIATSVTVKLYSQWPDYVFKPNYQLPSLAEVKSYIDRNQHLPEIPSAEQVEKNGLNLGEMNKLLVKKVEELTLYLIEKDQNETKQTKTIEALELGLKRQQQQVDELKAQIKSLKH